MNRDYHTLLKVVSILHLVGESENESDMTDRFSRLEDRIYSALCSINKVLRSLGWCEETRRRLYIERTNDMCEISNISERYIRNTQIFRSLRMLLINVALKYAQ